MYCPNCGYSNSDNSKFCLKCGTQLAAFVQAEAPVYNPAEQPAYNPYVQPGMRMDAPLAAQSKRKGASIGAAVTAIIAFLMFFLPWLKILDWDWFEELKLSFNYFDLMNISGDVGYYLEVDEISTLSTILVICMVSFSVLAIIAIVKGFMGKTSGWGIAAGIVGALMALVFAISLVSEFETMKILGIGAYLFFAASVTLLVLSCKK